MQVNGLKWADVNTNDNTSVPSKILPVIEADGKQVSGLENALAYVSEEVLAKPLTFEEKQMINLIDLKLNSSLV